MRVFKVGFGKTGTTSLHMALAMLGFRSCHDNHKCDTAVKAVIGKTQHRLLKQFNAFTDGEEGQRRYRELYEADPGAKFILTTRNVEHWLDSKIVNMLHNRMRNPRKAPVLEIDTALLRRQWEEHHTGVQAFFADKPGSLLVFNCCDGSDGWAELCKFLGTDIPRQPWPRGNPSHEKLREIKKYFKKRAGQG